MLFHHRYFLDQQADQLSALLAREKLPDIHHVLPERSYFLGIRAAVLERGDLPQKILALDQIGLAPVTITPHVLAMHVLCNWWRILSGEDYYYARNQT